MRAIVSSLRAIGMAGLLAGVSVAYAQDPNLTMATYDPNHPTNLLPTFFLHDSAKGSPFLVRGWLRGSLELTGHRRLPEPGHGLFFNYDKMNERVFATNGVDKPWTYSKDSISSLSLGDSNVVYNFEKIPLISRSHLLEALTRSERGYALYRRIITKFHAADYVNQGYLTAGRKFDLYVDSYEYYLVYPGHASFRKVNLKVRDVKKALRLESARVNVFFGNSRGGSVDPQALLVLVRHLNEQNGY